MALDESKYETMRFMRCKQCGNVYASGFDDTPECPECASHQSIIYRPDGAKEDSGDEKDESNTPRP
jgi:predicted Zn-ribbon and HTH transcriptional regulator